MFKDYLLYFGFIITLYSLFPIRGTSQVSSDSNLVKNHSINSIPKNWKIYDIGKTGVNFSIELPENNERKRVHFTLSQGINNLEKK